MGKHTQKSNRQKGFWEPVIVDNILQPVTYHWRGLEIKIPQTDLSGLNDGDQIFIENNADPLHLIEADAVNDYVPLSGYPASSPGPVIWKKNGELHYLYHEDET